MKTLLIGLDGATFDLVAPWVEAGHLPNLARLMREGTWGPLESTMPYITTTAWSTFATGLAPARHGILDFYQHRAGSRQIYFANCGERQGATFWTRASALGQRVCVVNVPMTYPPEAVNGVLVSGMDAPSTDSAFTHPPELRDDLLRRPGGYRIDIHFDQITGGRRADARHYRGFLDQLDAMTALRIQAMEDLARREPWDLFVGVFVAPDRVQHQLWQFHDPTHPAHDPKLAAEFADGILRVYRSCDAAVGRLLALAGPDTNVMVMSDHGAGPSHRVFYLRNWLEREGFLVRRDGGGGGPRAAAAKLLKGLFRAAKTVLPTSLKRRLKTRMGRDAYLAMRLYFDVDWTRTRAWSEGVCGNVFLSVRGRDPDGIVAPGAEYEAICRDITERLMRVRDPLNGRPVVAQVHRAADLLGGAACGNMPDLLVEGHPEYHCRGDCMLQDGAEQRPLFAPAPMSGSHKINGVFIGHGPAFARGGRTEGARIRDLCPTALHLLGLPVPDGLDGVVLEQAFDPAFRAAHPVRHGAADATPGGPAAGSVYSAADKALIADRLKALGYLE